MRGNIKTTASCEVPEIRPMIRAAKFSIYALRFVPPPQHSPGPQPRCARRNGCGGQVRAELAWGERAKRQCGAVRRLAGELAALEARLEALDP